MTILGPDGQPLAQVVPEVAPGLPAWIQGIAYRADDDITTIRIVVPDSAMAKMHLLACESTSQQLRALIEQLQRCLTQSEKTVLDVPAEETSSE